MKLKELVKLRSVFIELREMRFPLRTNYKIAHFLQKTDSDMNFYEEEYKKIITRHAEVDDKGERILLSPDSTNIKIKEGHVELCSQEIAELEDTDTIEEVSLALNVLDFETSGRLTIEQMYKLIPYLVE